MDASTLSVPDLIRTQLEVEAADVILNEGLYCTQQCDGGLALDEEMGLVVIEAARLVASSQVSS